MGARSLFLLGAVLFAGFAVPAPVAAQVDARGQLQLPEKSFNFGAVPQGKKVSHTFVLRNVGKGDLQIVGTTPSCGCTVAAVSAPVIKPGASESVSVEFDTSGFSGQKTKTVELLTSDTSNPRAVVSLTGTVLPGVTVEPRVLEFGRVVPGGASFGQPMQFTVKLPQGVSLTSANVPSQHVALQELSRSAAQVTYSVALKAGIPKGPFRDRVTLSFSDQSIAPLNVPLVAMVEGDIVVKPATLSFGVVSGEKPLERRVSFEYRSKAPLTIQNVSSSDSAVSAYYQPGSRGMNGTIVIQLSPSKVKGDLKATVEISTNHPTQPLTYINVFATTPPA